MYTYENKQKKYIFKNSPYEHRRHIEIINSHIYVYHMRTQKKVEQEWKIHL